MNAESRPTHSPDWYLDHVRSDVELLAAAITEADLEAPVVGCPGWSVSQLVEHLGFVHRWATLCAVKAARPSSDDMAALDPYDEANAAEWLRVGAARLTETLELLDPAAPTWHPFPVAQIAAVWPRRQAHETAVHRWDAERALGAVSAIDPELASDGIDEYFEVIVPRIVANGATLPAGSFHVHCTDVDGEWFVSNDGGDYELVRAHQKGDAVLRGPAASLLLTLWNRDVDDPEIQQFGDETVLAEWLAVGGN